MSPEDLLAAFETLAEAPDGIDRLRGLVLQLAVRGKIVPQNPEDEPANVLLDRIAEEKARLVNEGLIRKQSKIKAVEDEPYPMPDGWAWTCTAEIGVVSPRYSMDDDAEVGFVPMPVIPTDYRSPVEPERRRWKEIKTGYTHVADGDVVVAKITPCFQNRKSCVMGDLPNGIGAGTTELHVVRPINDSVLGKYLLLFYKTPDFIEGGMAEFTGTAGQQRVPRNYFMFTPLPLPPIAEQHRIVNRVDELMDLLDGLEAARDTREDTRTTLRDAALAALKNSDNREEAKIAWERVAERMDDLFTDPADVEPLRQTVLQLAVRGRLVPQDPNDEPASILLERIAKEKERLVKKKKIRKPKRLSPVTEDEVPFEVPDYWVVIPFGDAFVSVFTGPFGTSLKKSEYSEGGTPVINPQNLHDGAIVPTAATCVGPATLKRLQTFKLETRDLVVARRGEMGRCAVANDSQDGWLCGTGSLVLRPSTDLCVRYAAIFLRSPWTVARLTGDSVGSTMANLNQRIMLNIPFGLPPFAEQHRIVTKVDELMGLLDRLEERLVSRTAAHNAFATAAVHHLNA